MSTYLSRPIFPIEIDWSENPAASFSYNLRELQIGFGSLSVAPLQQQVVQGLQFSVSMKVDELIALDAFIADRQHGLKGFWLPAESEVFTMTGSLVNGVCLIKSQGLAAAWQSLPALYVWFQPDGAAPIAARIASVVTVDANTERVTLDNLALQCDGCAVRRLLYVRFAGDVEEAQFITEGYAMRKIRVVELPLEHAQVETGQRPVFLFDFAFELAGAVQHWRYTSFLDAVPIGGATYAPYPITYKSLRRSAKIEQTTCTIVTVIDPAGPFALYASGASELPLTVTIYKTTLPDLATPAVVFSGLATTVKLSGRQIEAGVSNFVAAFARRLPKMGVQRRCQWSLFDAATCGVDKSAFAKNATVLASADGLDMTVSSADLGVQVAGWFALGTLQVGTGERAQIRNIRFDNPVDANTRHLILDRAIDNPVGLAVTMLPGCNRAETTCAAKFNNYVNFGGHPFVPARNLSMSVTTDSSGGDKK